MSAQATILSQKVLKVLAPKKGNRGSPGVFSSADLAGPTAGKVNRAGVWHHLSVRCAGAVVARISNCAAATSQQRSASKISGVGFQEILPDKFPALPISNPPIRPNQTMLNYSRRLLAGLTSAVAVVALASFAGPSWAQDDTKIFPPYKAEDAAAVQPSSTAQSSSANPDLTSKSPGDYRIQPGDELAISVWKEPDLQSDVFVRPDGGISIPLAGDLPAGDRTTEEVRATIEQRLHKYIPDPVVTVAVKLISGNRIYVVGKVNHPGEFPLTGDIDVMQSLGLAGGTTPFASLNHIRVLRRENGKELSIRFRYSDIENGESLDQNILLHSGDTVVVP